jgi:hypothetical protein
MLDFSQTISHASRFRAPCRREAADRAFQEQCICKRHSQYLVLHPRTYHLAGRRPRLHAGREGRDRREGKYHE